MTALGAPNRPATAAVPVLANGAGGNDTLTLVLTDVGNLFVAPPVRPLSASDAEALGVAGVDHLLNVLHMDKNRQRAASTLALVLPPEQAAAVNAAELTRALHRYAELRLVEQRRELRNTYRYGWRITAIAIVILAVCIAASSALSVDDSAADVRRPLLRKTFEYGFEIVGWVSLWHPIEVLLYNPLALRARVAALRTLARLTVAIHSRD